MPEFIQNQEFTYEYNPYVEKNTFIGVTPKYDDPPAYEDIKDRLPKPIFDGHEDYLAAYDYAWRIAFRNTVKPGPESRFVSSFIDTAFNGCIFMWDSSFIMMFTKYAGHIFNFQGTLDNFYGFQHRDGFICREIHQSNGTDQFSHYDPSGTGPNILPWCEWTYYENMKDIDRLRRVYAPLRGLHLWFRKNMTWRDGTYFTTGWGCGMDNIPRQPAGCDPHFSHGHMVWIDTCFQLLLSAQCLIKMNEVLGGEDDVSDLKGECEFLGRVINDTLWDEKTQFYYDLWRDGRFNMIKHVGPYWGLIADAVPADRKDALVAHLENEGEFKRVGGVPALSADSEHYRADGCYWNGGVWAPTNYMVLKGLEMHGYHDLAYEIAQRYVHQVVTVFNETGTLWENYAPEAMAPGTPAKGEFVGWTGIVPISVFFEFILGIKANVKENCIEWHVNRTERHGIEKYPYGKDTMVDLICESRASEDEEPNITVTSDRPVTVKVIWRGGEKVITA